MKFTNLNFADFPRRFHRLALTIAGVCVALTLTPCSGESVTTSQAPSEDPLGNLSVTLTLDEPELASSDGFDLAVDIRMSGPARDLSLISIELMIPSAFRQLRPDLIASQPSATITDTNASGYFGGVKFDLKKSYQFNNQNRQWKQTINIRSAQMDKATFDRILAAAKSTSLQTCAYLRKSGGTEAPFPVWSNKVKLKLRSPTPSVYLGAGAGAVFLALLIGLADCRVATDGKWHSGKTLKHYVIFAISGGVASMAILLLASRLSDFAPPVSFQVNDFVGGMIVGLFSAKFGDTLAERFFPKKPEPNPKSPPADVP